MDQVGRTKVSGTHSTEKKEMPQMSFAESFKEVSLELLPEYPTDSNMEMETVIKKPEVNLEDAKDADKWKSKVMNMLGVKIHQYCVKVFYRHRIN